MHTITFKWTFWYLKINQFWGWFKAVQRSKGRGFSTPFFNTVEPHLLDRFQGILYKWDVGYEYVRVSGTVYSLLLYWWINLMENTVRKANSQHIAWRPSISSLIVSCHYLFSLVFKEWVFNLVLSSIGQTRVILSYQEAAICL